MICQECQQKPATLHLTKIINGKKTEIHLCEFCAQEKTEMFPGYPGNFSIPQLLSGLLFNSPDSSVHSSMGIAKDTQLRCTHCGLTFTQFSKSGRFGCSHCYKTFEGRLDPLFRRIHGNTHHSGKVPKRSGGTLLLKKEISQLRKDLQRSIEYERFEEAAKIRDRIRELEQQIGSL